MPEAFNAALLFLVNSVFDIFLFILAVRLILVWVKSDYYNPLSQFVVKCTNFIILPLRRVVPNTGRLESSTLLVIFACEICKFFLLLVLTYGVPNIVGVMILALEDIIKLIVQTFFYAILLQVILSWVQPFSPFSRILYQITSPIMRPVQRLVPPIGGIDISPIPALMLLQLTIILIVKPLLTLGSTIAIS